MNSKKSSKNRIGRTHVDRIRYQTYLPLWERWRDIGALVLGDLKNNGHFFNCPSGFFYFDKEERRAFPLCDDIGFAAVINRRYGINPKEDGFKRVLADLQSEASTNGATTEIRRLAHYDRRTNCLYVSQFNGSMCKLDGKSVTEVDNGTDNVFFFDDVRAWEPYEYLPRALRGELDRQLIESVNFENFTLSVTEQRLFLKLWLMGVFLETFSQPRSFSCCLVSKDRVRPRP